VKLKLQVEKLYKKFNLGVINIDNLILILLKRLRDTKDGVTKEGFAESYYLGRLERRKNVADESVREQAILKSVQGHNWS